MAMVLRRLSLLLASTTVLGAAAVGLAPMASAAEAAGAAPPAHVAPPGPQRCRPVHWGRDWRWDDSRRGGHWDHREWDRRSHRWEWKHVWWDKRFCDHGPGGPGWRH